MPGGVAVTETPPTISRNSSFYEKDNNSAESSEEESEDEDEDDMNDSPKGMLLPPLLTS